MKRVFVTFIVALLAGGWTHGSGNVQEFTQFSPVLGTGTCLNSSSNYTGTCITYVSSDGTDSTCKAFAPPVSPPVSAADRCQTLAGGVALTRSHKPDWVLLKGGDTTFFTTSASISNKGSAAGPLLIGSYPNLIPTIASDRAIIDAINAPFGTPFVSSLVGDGTPQYLAIIGIKLTNSGRDPGSPNFSRAALATQGGGFGRYITPFQTLLIENNEFVFQGSNFSTGSDGIVFSVPTSQISIRHNYVHHVYASSNDLSDPSNKRNGHNGSCFFGNDNSNVLFEWNALTYCGNYPAMITGGTVTVSNTNPTVVTWSNTGLPPAGQPPDKAWISLGGGTLPTPTLTIGSAGTGYSVNDLITLTGGTLTVAGQQAIIKVTSIGAGGSVTGAQVFSSGAYNTFPSNPVAQGSVSPAGGTGATFNVTWNVADITGHRCNDTQCYFTCNSDFVAHTANISRTGDCLKLADTSTATAGTSTAYWIDPQGDIFNHGFYYDIGWDGCSSNCDVPPRPFISGPITNRYNLISHVANIALNTRPGGTYYNNLMVQNPLGTVCCQYASTLSYNIILEASDIVQLTPIVQHGGFGFTNFTCSTPATTNCPASFVDNHLPSPGISGTTVTNNIAAHRTSGSASFNAFQLDPAENTGIGFFAPATTGITVTANIICDYIGNPNSGVRDQGSGNTTTGNQIDLTSGSGSCPAAAPSGPNPNLTLGQYLDSVNGGSGQTTDDFLTAANPCVLSENWSAGFCPQLRAPIVNNAFRNAFGMANPP